MLNKNKIILISILLLGLWMRLYDIDKRFFVTDEGYTADNCTLPIPSLVKYWTSEGHFPSYFVLMHYWIEVAGKSRITLRFPSALFGILSVYLVFLIGRRLFDERVGFLSGLFLATNTLNIYYSQCARPYTMAEFFVLASFLFFITALEKRSNFLWLGYLVSTFFALFISASTIQIIFCQILFIALFWENKYSNLITIKKISCIFLSIILIYVPLLLRLSIPLFEKGKLKTLYWIEPSSFGAIVDTFNSFGGSIGIDINSHMPKPYPSIFVGFFGAVIFLFALAGIYNSYRKSSRDNIKEFTSASLLVLWIFLPIFSLFVFSQIVSTAFGPVRYILYTSPAYYILVSKGLVSSGKKIRILSAVFMLISTLLFLNNYYNSDYFYLNGERGTSKEINNYIKKHIINDERLAFKVRKCKPAEFEMLGYLFPSAMIAIEDPLLKSQREDIRTLVKSGALKLYKIEELDFPGIWFIVWTPPGFYLDILNGLKENYSLVDTKSFSQFTVYHFRAK